MDIGTEKPAIVVEPLEDPFRRDAPAPPDPAPAEPIPAAEPVPAGRKGAPTS